MSVELHIPTWVFLIGFAAVTVLSAGVGAALKRPEPPTFIADRDLIDLVRWFAIPFGDSTPIFPTEDIYGNPLLHAQRLAQTYERAVGDPICEMWGCEHRAIPGLRRCTDHAGIVS